MRTGAAYQAPRRLRVVACGWRLLSARNEVDVGEAIREFVVEGALQPRPHGAPQPQRLLTTSSLNIRRRERIVFPVLVVFQPALREVYDCGRLSQINILRQF